MKIMKKMKLAVLAVLVIGTMAIESEAQGRGHDGFFLPLPPLPSVVFSYNGRDNHRDEYRERHRPSQVCWNEVERVERRHGGYREEMRTVCRDRGWRGHHDRGWRGHHDGGWRGHRDGWRDEHRGRDRW